MGLADASLGAWLGLRPPGQISIGLALGNTELSSSSGYRRLAVAGWEVETNSVRGEVAFGPFTEPVRFDTVVIYEDDTVIQMLSLPGVASLVAGFEHVQRLDIYATEVT
jgi:hypothetical protein